MASFKSAVVLATVLGVAQGLRLPSPFQPGECDDAPMTLDTVLSSVVLGSTMDIRSRRVNGGTFWLQSEIDGNMVENDNNAELETVVGIVDNSKDMFDKLDISIEASVDMMTGAGKLDLFGSFKFLTETKSSAKKLRAFARTQLRTSTLRIKEELLREKQIDNRHFEYATHVVSSIEYGADAVLMVDITIKEDEDTLDIEGLLSGSLDGAIKGKVDARAKFEELMINQGREYTISYVGDVPINAAAITDLSGVLDALDEFKENLKDVNGGLGVPKKVTLTPLCQLRDEGVEMLISNIQEDSLAEVLEVYLSLQRALTRAEDIKNLASSDVYKLPRILEKAIQFEEAVTKFRSKLRTRLAELLPLLRTSPPSLKPEDLALLMDHINNSPFGENNLNLVYEGLLKEIKFYRTYIDAINSKVLAEFTPETSPYGTETHPVKMLGAEEDATSFTKGLIVLNVFVARDDATEFVVKAMNSYMEAPSSKYIGTNTPRRNWYPDIVANADARRAIDNMAAFAIDNVCVIWTEGVQNEACPTGTPRVLNLDEVMFRVADYNSDPEVIDKLIKMGLSGQELQAYSGLTESTTLMVYYDAQNNPKFANNVFPTPEVKGARDPETAEPYGHWGLIGADKVVRSRGACASGLWDETTRKCRAVPQEPRPALNTVVEGVVTCTECGNMCLSARGRMSSSSGEQRPLLIMEPCSFAGEDPSSIFKYTYQSDGASNMELIFVDQDVSPAEIEAGVQTEWKFGLFSFHGAEEDDVVFAGRLGDDESNEQVVIEAATDTDNCRLVSRKTFADGRGCFREVAAKKPFMSRMERLKADETDERKVTFKFVHTVSGEVPQTFYIRHEPPNVEGDDDFDLYDALMNPADEAALAQFKFTTDKEGTVECTECKADYLESTNTTGLSCGGERKLEMCMEEDTASPPRFNLLFDTIEDQIARRQLAGATDGFGRQLASTTGTGYGVLRFKDQTAGSAMTRTVRKPNGQLEEVTFPMNGTCVSTGDGASGLNRKNNLFLAGALAPLQGEATEVDCDVSEASNWLRFEGDRIESPLQTENGNALCLTMLAPPSNDAVLEPCLKLPNQKFYMNSEGEIVSQFNKMCLDYHYLNGNMYFHPCHGGWNQRFIFDTEDTAKLQTTKIFKHICPQRNSDGDIIPGSEVMLRSAADAEGCISDWVIVPSPCVAAATSGCRLDGENAMGCFANIENANPSAQCVALNEIDACENNPCEADEFCRDLPAPALDGPDDRVCEKLSVIFPGFQLTAENTPTKDKQFEECPAGTYQSGDMTECEPHRVTSCVGNEVMVVKPSPVSDGKCKACSETERPEPNCDVGECTCVPLVFSSEWQMDFKGSAFDDSVHTTDEFKAYLIDVIEKALLLEEGKPKLGKVEPGPVDDGQYVKAPYMIVDDVARTAEKEEDNQKQIIAYIQRNGDKYNLTTGAGTGPNIALIAGAAGGGAFVLMLVAFFAVRRARSRGQDEKPLALGAPANVNEMI